MARRDRDPTRREPVQEPTVDERGTVAPDDHRLDAMASTTRVEDEDPDQDRDAALGRALAGAATPDVLQAHHHLARLQARLFERPPVSLHLDRYVLLRTLGEGGAGRVYDAYDPELDRRVAIKVLLPDAHAMEDGATGRRRLIREAQAIAKLDHPNVVGVYDVGTYGPGDLALADPVLADAASGTEGVYIVMERVDGVDLRTWLRQRPRPWSQVLALHLAAGRGLAAAHRAGVVHRDFKPSNVLVTPDARAKVVDFGLARRIDVDAASTVPSEDDPLRQSASSASDVDLTQTGAIVGTPAFMAPEQHRGEAVDPRADQFAFCVSLYLGLMDAPPFRGASLGELARAKADEAFEVPPRERRRKVPAAILRAIRRGLRADPEARFADMDALLRALQAPALQRRRMGWTAALVVVTGVAAGLGHALSPAAPDPCDDAEAAFAGLWDGATREATGQAFTTSPIAHARDTWRTVAERFDRYTEAWTEQRDALCRATMHDPGPRTAAALDCLERQRRRFRELSRVLAGVDDDVVEHALALTGALPEVSACDPDHLTDETVAEPIPGFEATLSRADALLVARKLDEATPVIDELLTEARAREDGSSEARVLLRRAKLRAYRGQADEVREDLYAALYAAEAAGDRGAGTMALVELVEMVGLEDGRPDDAERIAQHALARQAYADPGPLRRADLQLALGLLRHTQGRFDASLQHLQTALALRESLLGPHHPDVLDVLLSIGGVQADHDLEAAAQTFATALERLERDGGPSHPSVGRAITNLAIIAVRQGDYALARRYDERALAIWEANGRTRNQAIVLTNLASLCIREERYDEALGHQQRAVELLHEVMPPEHPLTITAEANLGNVYIGLDRHTEGIALLERALEQRRRVLGERHHTVGRTHLSLGQALYDTAQPRPARAHFQSALEILREQYGEDSPKTAAALRNLARIALDEGQRDTARTLAHDALRVLQSPDGDPVERAQTHMVLARAQHDDDPDAALEHARAADGICGTSSCNPATVSDIDAWLAAHTTPTVTHEDAAMARPAAGSPDPGLSADRGRG